MFRNGSLMSEQQRFLTVRQAASRLGVGSERVRRMLQAGYLTGVKIPNTPGPQWRIHADSLPNGFTTRQAAAFVGCSRRALIGWLNAGLVKGAFRFGGEWRIPRTALYKLRREHLSRRVKKKVFSWMRRATKKELLAFLGNPKPNQAYHLP
jgi:excisionase family DNA binding protein